MKKFSEFKLVIIVAVRSNTVDRAQSGIFKRFNKYKFNGNIRVLFFKGAASFIR